MNFTNFNNKNSKLSITSITSIVIAVFILLTTACSSSDELKDEYAKSSAEDIYKEAVTYLDDGKYEPAIKAYEALENHFPFGDLTTKGQLEIIFAYYKNQDFLQAITASERFLRLHPFSNKSDYAYYMSGLANYEQNITFLNRIVSLNPAIRDTTNYRAAFNDFQNIVKKYPESKYAADAKQRMIYIRNLLAEHEINVAEYYIKREAYLAAANRARYVIEHLPNTPAEKQAIVILDDMYTKLKLPKTTA